MLYVLDHPYTDSGKFVSQVRGDDHDRAVSS